MTSKVFCRVTQWTGFYVMKTSVMRELDNSRYLSILHIRHGEIKKQRDHDNSKSILKTSESVSKSYYGTITWECQILLYQH